MKKLNLFLDFDNTLVNTTKACVALYNKDFEQNENYLKNKSWNFRDVMKKEIASDEYIYSLFEDKRFFEDLEFYEGVEETLNEIKDLYKITIVTVGTEENLKKKERWLIKNFPIDFIFKGVSAELKMDKSEVNMATEKSVFIDDHQKCINTSNAVSKLLMYNNGETDWNKEANATKKVKNWNEIKTFLLENSK